MFAKNSTHKNNLLYGTLHITRILILGFNESKPHPKMLITLAKNILDFISA